ncbi:MAG TPA: glycosyltransferase family 4 protein [Pyrinomonadaceae bacterium]|nr:glycosyltransferase family 4 protein [Pyrinomonadaceae bacterium]
MKVLAIVPYHTQFCAGQRFRIELWASHLKARGIEVEYYPFATPALTEILYKQGQLLRKSARMLQCYAGQLGRVLVPRERPDVVYIYREAALIGPALIESLVRRWGVPIIYDIDEPLFVPYVSPTNGRLNKLKFFSKIDTLFEMSDHVLAVNEAIAEYAARRARKVSVVPMAVDTERYAPAPESEGYGSLPYVGWVGTLTNQPNLELIAEPLRRLHRTHPSVLRVIADESMKLPGVEVEFIKWSYEAEVPKLRECQVGVVPVKPSAWGPYKFFFKLIQYMSLGMPVVASAIGSNLEIVEDGVNGFLARDDDEWHARLLTLLEDADLRRRMGAAARRTVEERFSLTGQIDFMENVFRSAPSLVGATARGLARAGHS